MASTPHSNAQISGSTYGRGVACSAAFALPSVDGGSSDAAERGTAIHAFVYNAITNSIAPLGYAQKNCPVEYLDECSRIDIDTPLAWANEGEQWFAEIALVYDAATDTARMLHIVKERDYGDLKPSEIPLTLDLVVQAGTVAKIKDWKSGTYHDPAQLRIAAVGVARWLGVEVVEVAFAFL